MIHSPTPDDHTPTEREVVEAWMDRVDFLAQVAGVDRPTDEASEAELQRFLAQVKADAVAEYKAQVAEEIRAKNSQAIQAEFNGPTIQEGVVELRANEAALEESWRTTASPTCSSVSAWMRTTRHGDPSGVRDD